MSKKGILNRWAMDLVREATPEAYTTFTYTGMMRPVEIELSKYLWTAGGVVFEAVQVIALIPMSQPEFYLALKDENGSCLSGSRWKESDFWGLATHGVGFFDDLGGFEEG